MTDERQVRLTDQQLWTDYKRNGNPEARRQLIETHMKLVDYVAGRVAIGLPRNCSKDDLISYGAIGLIDAIEKFDFDRGLQFETYASWRIRGAIIDGLRQGDWVPRSVREKAKRLEEAYEKLEQQYMRSVTDKEMMEYLQVDERQFEQMVSDAAVTTVYSLEDPLKDDESETRMTVLVDDKAVKPESKVDQLYQKETLAKAIERLTEKEKIVISLFYYEDLALGEIAEVMQLTPSRISQLHSKAMLRLRAALSHSKTQLLQD